MSIMDSFTFAGEGMLGLPMLKSYTLSLPTTAACFMRTHEVLDILDVSEMILNACLLRKSSSKQLCFDRSDYPEMDPERDHHLITIRQENGSIIQGAVPGNYFGDLETEYEKRNQEYIGGER